MSRGSIIDLFSGAGGFGLSAHSAGFTTKLAIDIDKDITASYNINFPHTTLLLEDISKISPKNVIKHVGLKPGTVDGILGGPPCQGFSSIGKKDVKDSRNALISHFFSFVKIVMPKFFVMENVPGLLSESCAGILWNGIEQVDSIYKILGPLTLNTADFGAATNRRRVFVIGYRKEYIDDIEENDLDKVKAKPANVYEAIHDIFSVKSAGVKLNGECWLKIGTFDGGYPNEYVRQLSREPMEGLSVASIRRLHSLGFVSGFAGTKHSSNVLKRFAKVEPGKYDKISKCARLKWDKPCPTLRAGTGKDRGGYQSIRPIHPEENRVICVREAARIQGFPDWFQFHRTKWHSFRMIGNSVSPFVGNAILTLIGERMGIGSSNGEENYRAISAYTG